MGRPLAGVAVAAALAYTAFAALPGAEPAGAAKVRVLIAFSSYRARPLHPNIYFYEHDGVESGKIVGGTATPRPGANAEAHPSLTRDGRYCAFTFEVENNPKPACVAEIIFRSYE